MLPISAAIDVLGVLGGGSSDDVRWEWITRDHEMGGTTWDCNSGWSWPRGTFFFGS